MAGDLAVSVGIDGILEPPSPSLQNCIKFSSSGRYFSALCDFGAVCICELKEIGDNFKVILVKRLAYGKGELLEGHAWSSDDQIFAVAGCKIYLFNVCQGFSSLYTISLYYMPKDISFVLNECSSETIRAYSLAVAGPNGVELYQMEMADNFKMGGFSSLHADLAIALVEFSPNKQYLAVAALDGHFGIWTVSSLDTDQKEFWYVHLKTVRITSMEFSPDSNMVAVAGWEGSWHVYTKVIHDEQLAWEEFHHGTSIDRVSGDLPGSFISWSPDNRFVRLTQCNEKTSCLLTFDTQTSVTTEIPLDGIVKGIASFRQMSADYTLCFLSSKQCFAVKWPQCHPAPNKISVANEQDTQLLFHESLEGSLLVERSAEGGVTLKWSRTSKECLDLLKKISERGSQNLTTNDCQSSELQPRATSVRETVAGSEKLQDKDASGSELSRTDVSLQVNETIKSFTDCKQENTLIKKAEAVSKLAELDTDKTNKDYQFCEENKDKNEHRILEEVERTSGLSGESMESHNVDSTEHGSRNIRVTSSLTNDVLHIQAPFLNPRLFQKSGTDSLWRLSGSSVQVLISTKYVIMAILPLMAYVYYKESDEWRSLLFPCAVNSCCITQDKYLVLLTNEGSLRIWCLQSMTMLYCSHEVICGTKNDAERFIMSGNSFEHQCNIKLDKTGTGEVLRISFQPNRDDPRVCVTSLPVCYLGLMSHRCSNYLFGSVGHLIIFKEGQYFEYSDQMKPSQDHEEVSLVKWVVIVPELHISRTFLEESICSWEGFIIRHYSALYQLENLTLSAL